jgi:hypothetical protein
MYSKFLKDYVIKEGDSIYKAAYKLMKNRNICFVVDNNEKFVGIISQAEMNKALINESLTVMDICNKKCTTIIDDEDIYSKARNIYGGGATFNAIPILNREKDIIDIMTKNRAFYKLRYNEHQLPRQHYATCLVRALSEAKILGYDRISVIEFGVAGGSGLRCLEFHANECARLFGIQVEVYGFDWGDGLHETDYGYKDLPHLFPVTGYNMGGQEELADRLRCANLIIGDIRKTCLDFQNKHHPAPIGAVMIDVDYYSSTVDILNYFESLNEDMLIPRVWMYFDDLHSEYEYQGEDLAIKEFNKRNSEFNISPEGRIHIKEDFNRNLKVMNVFKHSKYNDSILTADREQLPFIDTI